FRCDRRRRGGWNRHRARAWWSCSTRSFALARGSPAFPPTMAEALLLGSRILRRPLLPFLHTSRIATVAKTVIVQTHLSGVSAAVSGPFAMNESARRFPYQE